MGEGRRAVGGVKPAKLIRLSKSCIGEAEKSAVIGVLDREYLGMGAEVERFERALSDFFGRPAVCVVNGTAALHLALQACGVGSGDEVLVPSLTYVASFQAISATGAKPVACDVDAGTLVLDWRDAESRLSSRTRAVMTVHYTGGVGDLDGIYAFAARHGLRVIEDAAHAFGTTHRGRRVGSFGDIACFSFDGVKNITSGEGGCVVTSDLAILQQVRDARLLGVERDTEKRYRGERSWEFDVAGQGWRYHMSNIMAAIGSEQLKRFTAIAEWRRARARLYDVLLHGRPRIHRIQHDYDEVVPHIYVVRIAGLKDRTGLRAHLLAQDIESGIHYPPNHLLTRYRHPSGSTLTNTERICSEILTLPLHCELKEGEVEWVCTVLNDSI